MANCKSGAGLSPLKARLLLRSNQSTAQLCNNPKPCRYGDRCMFAHNLEEARLFREAHGSSWQQRPQSGEHEGSASTRWQAQGAAAGQAQDRDQPFCHPARYKTLLCNFFERRGECRFGASCNFAHGARELRPEPVFPNPSSSFDQRGDGPFRRESAPEPPAYGMGPEEYETPAPPAAVHAVHAVPFVVGSGPQEWDAEVLASAAAAAVPVGEAYAAQQLHDRAQQGQQQAGSQSRPAVRVGGLTAATPYLASRDEFPALGASAVPAGVRGKGAVCAAGVAGTAGAGAAGGGRQATRPWCDMSSGSSSPLSGDASKCPSFEWDGNASPGGSAPLTVCFSEDNLRCHTASVGTASGSSRACSVRSGGGEWEVPTVHITAHNTSHNTAHNTSHTMASRLGPSPETAPAAAAAVAEPALAVAAAAAPAAAAAAGVVAESEQSSEERCGGEAGTEAQGEEAEKAVASEAAPVEVAGKGGAEEEQAAASAAEEEEEEEEAGEVYDQGCEEQAELQQAEQHAAVAQANQALPLPLPRKLSAVPAVVYFDAKSAQGDILAAAAAPACQLPPPVPAMMLPRVSLPPPGFPATPAAAPQLGAAATPAAAAAVAPSAPAPAPVAPCQPQTPAEVVAGGAAADARSALWERVTRAGGVDLSLIPSFICPITHRPFHNPVVAADGITYEKEEITDWLYRQNKELSPVTGQLLPHRLLLPNEAVRRAMGEVAELIRALAI